MTNIERILDDFKYKKYASANQISMDINKLLGVINNILVEKIKNDVNISDNQRVQMEAIAKIFAFNLSWDIRAKHEYKEDKTMDGFAITKITTYYLLDLNTSYENICIKIREAFNLILNITSSPLIRSSEEAILDNIYTCYSNIEVEHQSNNDLSALVSELSDEIQYYKRRLRLCITNNFNVEMQEYEGLYKSADYFTSNPSANTTVCKTTKKALVLIDNDEENTLEPRRCLIKGHFIFPIPHE